MTKESGPQPPQTRPVADTDQPAEVGSQLTDGAHLAARHHYDVLYDMLAGRTSPESEALDKAAADDYAALKSALTPTREAALHDLAAGKGSAQAIIEVLRPVPRLLDIMPLPHTPRVLAIRELMEVSNFRKEWDGYLDKYWTLGQTVLWIATADPWAVDQASNDSGGLGEFWGQHKARVVNDALNLPREQIQQAANKLRRRCLDGRMTVIDDHGRPIPAIAWLHLKIVLDEKKVPSVRHVRQSTIEPADQNVVFLRAEVLGEFKPEEPPTETYGIVTQELAAHMQGLSLRGQQRTRLANWFKRRQGRIPLERRYWLSLSDIADEYARKHGSLAIDHELREEILDSLQNSILKREFVDKQGRSRVLNLHPSSVGDCRFDPESASIAELFRPHVEHLWIKHQDCVDWFIRHRVDLPHRLRRELSSTVLPVATRVDVEPRTLAKRLRPANKSLKEKEADALETAKTFIIDGVAPCVKEHATAVMGVLKRQHPQNHIRREDLERLLATEFKAQRRPQGNSRRTR